jgi:hypothetical protein
MVLSLLRSIHIHFLAFLLKGYQRCFAGCNVNQSRGRWEDNIKMELLEVGSGGTWTGLISLRIGTVYGHW